MKNNAMKQKNAKVKKCDSERIKQQKYLQLSMGEGNYIKRDLFSYSTNSEDINELRELLGY